MRKQQIKKIKKVIKTLPHFIFWTVQILLNLYAILITMDLTSVNLKMITSFMEQSRWQKINQLLTTPTFILPLATTFFVIYYHYIKKRKLKLLKLIFNYEIPILILALTALFQQWINPGQILILILFYIIITIKILLSFPQKLPLLQQKDLQKTINSIIKPIEHIITLYYIGLITLLSINLTQFMINNAEFNSIYILDLLFFTIISLLFLISTIIYLTIQITQEFRKRKFNWLIYGTSTIFTILLLISCGYINQHYSTNNKTFDHPLFVKLTHTKDYNKKQEIKKEIASQYSRDDFSQTLSNNSIKDPDNYYISIEDLSLTEELPISSNLKVAYRHYLSVLLPLKREVSKKIYKERVLSSIYGCNHPTKSEYIKNPDYHFYGNCIQSSINTGFESRQVELNSIYENLTQNSDKTINSEILIKTKNPDSNNGQFTLTFNLPSNSTITQLYVKNQKTQKWEASQLVPQNIGEKIYHEELIKHLPKDPAVLTQLYKDYYQLKVFPVPPESNYELKIDYTALPKTNDLNQIGFKADKLKTHKTLNKSEIQRSSYYKDEDSTFLLTQAPQFTTEPIQSKVIFILDNSYSMKDSLNISTENTPHRIYQVLQKQNIKPLIYTMNNGISLKTDKQLRYLSTENFYGYSNRKLAFNKLFLDRNVWGTKHHIIYITDDESDLEFEDTEFTSITNQSIKGITIPEQSKILSFNVIQFSKYAKETLENDNPRFDAIVQEFLKNNQTNIYSTNPSNLNKTEIDKISQEIIKDIQLKEYLQKNTTQIKLNDQILSNYQAHPINNNQILISTTEVKNKELKNIKINNHSQKLTHCNNCESLKLMANYQKTNSLTKELNYYNDNFQRNKVGNKIFNIGIENKILVPYTSWIFVETQEQQDRIDELMKQRDKFDKDYNSSSLNLVQTGQKDVWLFLLTNITVILIILYYQKKIKYT